YWVNQRWLGGMLTNYRTIQTRIKRLEELNQMEANGTMEKLPKKEAMHLLEERGKLERYLGGIKNMPKLPGAIYIVDLKKERGAHGGRRGRRGRRETGRGSACGRAADCERHRGARRGRGRGRVRPHGAHRRRRRGIASRRRGSGRRRVNGRDKG